MTDESLNDKLERLLSLMEAQLELTKQGQREERLHRARLSGEEAIEPSHQEDDASASGDPSLSRSKPVATPFPKFNPR